MFGSLETPAFQQLTNHDTTFKLYLSRFLARTVSLIDFNPIKDEYFRAAHRRGGGGVGRRGGGEGPPPKNLSHISHNDETWHSYSLPKEDPKNNESRDTPPKFC